MKLAAIIFGLLVAVDILLFLLVALLIIRHRHQEKRWERDLAISAIEQLNRWLDHDGDMS